MVKSLENVTFTIEKVKDYWQQAKNKARARSTNRWNQPSLSTMEKHSGSITQRITVVSIKIGGQTTSAFVPAYSK